MKACLGDKKNIPLSTLIVHLPNVEQLGVLRGLRCMSPKDLLRLLYAKSIKKNRPTKVVHIKKRFLSTEMPILVDRMCEKLLLSIEMGILVDRMCKKLLLSIEMGFLVDRRPKSKSCPRKVASKKWGAIEKMGGFLGGI